MSGTPLAVYKSLPKREMGEMTASLRCAPDADILTALWSVPGSAFPDTVSLRPLIWQGFAGMGSTPKELAAWPFVPGGLRLRQRHPVGDCVRLLQQVPDRTPR